MTHVLPCLNCHGSRTVYVTRHGRPDDPEPVVVLDAYPCPRCLRTEGGEPCEVCGEEPATERLEDGASGTPVCLDCVPEALVVLGTLEGTLLPDFDRRVCS